MLYIVYFTINPLNAELNPICYLLGLLEAHHIPHVSRIRVTATCFVAIAILRELTPILF